MLDAAAAASACRRRRRARVREVGNHFTCRCGCSGGVHNSRGTQSKSKQIFNSQATDSLWLYAHGWSWYAGSSTSARRLRLHQQSVQCARRINCLPKLVANVFIHLHLFAFFPNPESKSLELIWHQDYPLNLVNGELDALEIIREDLVLLAVTQSTIEHVSLRGKRQVTVLERESY